MINFADAFMEAVNFMETAWSEDEDCKQIFASMDAEENEQVLEFGGRSHASVRQWRRKTKAREGKSMKKVSTEDGEEAHDDASDDDDEPSDEDTTSSPK